MARTRRGRRRFDQPPFPQRFPSQAPWAVRHLGSQAVRHTSSDGAVTVALSVRSPEALRSFVLGFLDGAVVLEPPELRALMIDWLTTMMAEPGI